MTSKATGDDIFRDDVILVETIAAGLAGSVKRGMTPDDSRLLDRAMDLMSGRDLRMLLRDNDKMGSRIRRALTKKTKKIAKRVRAKK